MSGYKKQSATYVGMVVCNISIYLVILIYALCQSVLCTFIPHMKTSLASSSLVHSSIFVDFWKKSFDSNFWVDALFYSYYRMLLWCIPYTAHADDQTARSNSPCIFKLIKPATVISPKYFHYALVCMRQGRTVAGLCMCVCICVFVILISQMILETKLLVSVMYTQAQ